MTSACSLLAPGGLALLLVGLAPVLGFAQRTDERPPPGKLWVYIGTYTGTGAKESKGIYRCELDLTNGKLSTPELAGETKNPSFVAIHPTRKFLYAVGEISDFGKKKTGAVSAFAIDPATGKLTLLNQQESGGAGPCHLTVDATGKNVLVANYGGGSVASLPIQADGKLGPATSVIQHKGKSKDPGRQEGPHAHSVNLDAANRFAFVADLGLDRILIYKFDPEKGTLTPNDPPFFATAPGAGPRHFAFHPDGKHAFVINEMASTLTSMTYDPATGTLKEVETVSTLKGKVPGNSTAEVQVHPSGEFVYGSNRGHNSIVAFAIQKDGKLKYIGHQGAEIKIPRNFGVEPMGRFVLVANQDGNSIVVFAVDEKTGALKPTGHKVEVPRPVCVKFMMVPK